MDTDSHAVFNQLAEGLGLDVKCFRGMKTRTEKRANGAKLTARKNRRRPMRARDLSDHDARSGLLTASKKREAKLMIPMIVNMPTSTPSKMNGGKILCAEAVSGGM